MGDDAADAPEGWRVRQRPAMIAGIATPVVLLGSLLVAAHFYRKDLRPPPPLVTTFPAPGIETFIHDGAHDPQRPVRQGTTDLRIQAAKRAVVRDRPAGWSVAR